MPLADTDGNRARVYGLRGFDHGGGILMTLMSAEGAVALAARIAPLAGPRLRLVHEPGRLPVCHEIRAGEFAVLVEALDVDLLGFPAWTETKRRLGEVIYR